MHHVFISYCRSEQHVAEVVEAELDNRGLNCWRDLSAMPGGVRWQEEIKEALARTRAMVLLASESAAESRYVQCEVDTALELDRPIVPIKFREAPPERFAGQLGELNFVTFPGSDPTPNGLRQLMAGLKNAGLGLLDDEDDTGLAWGHLEEYFGPFSASDRDRLDRIADLTRRHYQATPGAPVWSVHGLRHANRLLYALADVLEMVPELDRHEAFCLVAAACLHDIALVAPDYEARDPVEVRNDHASMSADWLTRASGLPSIRPREAHTIGHLLRFHNMTRNLRELANAPRVAGLAAAFRLANACDVGLHRAPLDLWRRYHDQIAQDGQASFWLVNATIENVLVDRETHTIRVHGRAPTHDLMFIPKQLAREIGRRCVAVSPYLCEWRVEFAPRAEPDLDRELPVSREEMVRIVFEFAAHGLRDLSGPHAHLESSSSLVEDIIAAALAIADPDYRSSVEDKLACVGDLVGGLLDARGELHLLHALKAQVQDALRQTPVDEEKLARVARTVADFRKPQSFEGITHHALAKLRQAVPGRELRAFVFGKSGPVTAFLRSCAAQGIGVRIYTPVMRPVGEGAALEVPAALDSPPHDDIEVVVVPDAAISHVLVQPELEEPAERGCDLVLMGCEAVFARPDRELADIGTSLGARPIADLAKAADISLWVLTDTGKFVAYPSRSPWYTSGLQVQSVGAEDFMHEEDAVRWTHDRGQAYPRSETVPGELIDYIVTDEGAFTPAQAADQARSRLQPEG